MELKILLVSPHEPAAQSVIRMYLDEIVSRFHGRRATESEIDEVLLSEPADDLQGPTGAFAIGVVDARPVACAGVRFDGASAELTKLFTVDAYRGKGIAGAMLAHMESVAAERSARELRLDTRSDLVEACELYERHGFRRVPAFNAAPHSDRWYAKTLPGARTAGQDGIDDIRGENVR